MILFALGIVIGLLLAVIVFLSAKRYNISIERTLKQLKNKVKEKGEIFVETDEAREVDRLLENLPIE